MAGKRAKARHFAKRKRQLQQSAKDSVGLAQTTMTFPDEAFKCLGGRNGTNRKDIPVRNPSRTTSSLAVATGLAFCGLCAATASAADLEIRLDGLASADGVVRAALHRQVPGAKFPGDAGVVAAAFRPAAKGSVRIVFADLPAGDYAVTAFHDADGDGELARNLVGMPTESYGFSNDAHGFMGPPSFKAAAVTVGAGDTPVRIAVKLAGPVAKR